MRSKPRHEALYAVVLRSLDGDLEGEAITKRGLTKEAAERAAAKVNDMEGPFVATVVNSFWRLVSVA